MSKHRREQINDLQNIKSFNGIKFYIENEIKSNRKTVRSIPIEIKKEKNDPGIASVRRHLPNVFDNSHQHNQTDNDYILTIDEESGNRSIQGKMDDSVARNAARTIHVNTSHQENGNDRAVQIGDKRNARKLVRSEYLLEEPHRGNGNGRCGQIGDRNSPREPIRPVIFLDDPHRGNGNGRCGQNGGRRNAREFIRLEEILDRPQRENSNNPRSGRTVEYNNRQNGREIIRLERLLANRNKTICCLKIFVLTTVFGIIAFMLLHML